MGLNALLDRLEAQLVTPNNNEIIATVTHECSNIAICTSVTSDTLNNAIDILSTQQNRDSADLLAHFEERAAIIQFDGNLPMEEAEILALDELLQLANPVDAQNFPNDFG